MTVKRVPLVCLALPLCLSGLAVGKVMSADGPGSSSRPTQIAPLPEANGWAVGYGAASRGGTGGKIMAVTTLADSGPGSLRECLEARGARVCVFRVSGVIRFTQRPPQISNPYLTIAGQTAPGPGITLAHGGGEEGRTPLLIKNTHDIIVRDIRVRADRIGVHRGSEDSITIENSDNVIIDHVSASWARDELVNGYDDNDRITVSNSIFAEGIPRHDKCALLASDPKDAQRFSFIGNLCAHSGDRNPDLNFPPGSCVEVINNIFYNANSIFAEIWESFGGTPVSLVGNSFIAGPETPKHTIGISRNKPGSVGQAKVYLWDNQFFGKFKEYSDNLSEVVSDKPVCPLTVRPASAATARDKVLDSAGARPRDSLDARIVSDVRQRQGHFVRTPGKIPPEFLASDHRADAYPDADSDGMDDRWEEKHGISSTRYNPWDDHDGDGISNFEAFLADREHGLDARKAAQ